jgi:hypothetical protein
LNESERQELRDLIAEQERLLAAVAADPLLGDGVKVEYRERHRAIRARLAPNGFACFCVYDSIEPWRYTPHPEVQDELDRMRAPLAGLLYQEETPWRLVLYRRDGNPHELPFLDDFALGLGDAHFDILEASLRSELAVMGTNLLVDRRKAHTFDCKGGRPKTAVLMYKIEEGTSSMRVVLRIFFETAPGRTIVLLHGYDKGADDSERREKREAAVACERLRDLKAQLADPTTRGDAIATPWPD